MIDAARLSRRIGYRKSDEGGEMGEPRAKLEIWSKTFG